MADFQLRQNDESRTFEDTLRGMDGQAVDLSNANSVGFHMKKLWAETAKVDASATIKTAASGKVSYTFGASDTDEPGTFQAEWEVKWGSGDIESFPKDRYLRVKVKPELA